MTTMMAQACASALHLGVDDQGAPVTWSLHDEQGRPRHGVILGNSGSGGTIALHRLAGQARRAGLHGAYIDLDHGPDYAHTPQSMGFVGVDEELSRDLKLLTEAQNIEETAPDGVVLLVDGASALRCAPSRWERLMDRIQAGELRVSIVARVHALSISEIGFKQLRDLLLGDGQYLVLGRPTGRQDHLARMLLPGYTTPGRSRSVGRGVYGHRGRTTPITVARPRLPEVEECLCPACSTWSPWLNGRAREAGDPVDEFWCTRCGTETALDRCTRRST